VKEFGFGGSARRGHEARGAEKRKTRGKNSSGGQNRQKKERRQKVKEINGLSNEPAGGHNRRPSARWTRLNIMSEMRSLKQTQTRKSFPVTSPREKASN